MSKLINDTKVLLTNVRLSYPHIFTPQAFDAKQDEKYSASLIIDKNDDDTLKIVSTAISNAMEAGLEDTLHGKNKKSLRFPLRDGDNDRPEDKAYENAYFINASSKRQPDVVAKYKDPETGNVVFLDEDDVYPGCYVNVTVNFYPYNVRGNAGIAAGLGNVQKAKDGARLDGATSADQEFTFEEPEEADLESPDDAFDNVADFLL